MVYVFAGAFILLDLITGVVKAFKEKNWCSTVMREGLFHKIGSLLTIVFGVMVDYAQTFVDIGVTIPMSSAICSYIIIMEIGSIIENVCIINPEILPDKIKGYFQKLSK